MKRLPFVLFAPLFAAAAHAATISGTVIGDTNQALASMTVTAYTTAGVLQSSGATTASGTYALTVPAGSYRVLAYDPAGAFATSFYADAESFETSATLALTSAQNATNINFRLVRAGFAVGRVSDAADAALAHMTVAAYNLSGTRRGFTTTSATGNFTLALPPGTYKIGAYDEELTYAAAFFDNATSFDTAAPIAIVANTSSTANLQLPLAARLAGLVTDRTTLAPIANARVTAYASDGNIAARTLTGADGRYAAAARPGALRIVIDDPAGNYATTYVPNAISFPAAPPFAAVEGETLTVNATMERAGHLSGRVSDRISGKPLAGITAAAYNADGTTRAFATTDAGGLYSLVVPAGDFRLGTFDPSLVYLPQFHANQTSFASATIVHASTQQTIGGFDFALTKGARVTGRVTSRPLGTPLAAITVGAYDVTGHLIASTSTDASGQYTLLLTPATVKLLAFDDTLRFARAYYLDAQTFDTTQALSLIEGQSLTADFAMSEAGTIGGVVVSAATLAPLANMSVVVYDLNLRPIADTTTDTRGSFRIAVPAGTYLLAAGDPALRYTSSFYGGGSGSIVHVSAHQEMGPLEIRLMPATASSRRRAVSH